MKKHYTSKEQNEEEFIITFFFIIFSVLDSILLTINVEVCLKQKKESE